MDRQSFEKLDYYKLLAIIAEGAHSPVSRQRVMSLEPLQDVEDIRLRNAQIEDIRAAIQRGFAISLQEYSDIVPLIKKSTPQGAILDAFELYCFIAVFENTEHILGLLGQHPELVSLQRVVDNVNSCKGLLKRLKLSVDAEGNILDTASSALKAVRTSIRGIEAKIRRKLEDLVQSKEIAVFLQDNFITQRSGRWVIPVRMDSKGQVSGVVHDVSKSGETAFIEPLSIINLTNELENMRAEEKSEEIKVLRELSDDIRGNAEIILLSFEALVYYDLLNAIANYAERLSMESPSVVDSPGIKLFNARHPLLYNSLQARGMEDTLVPLDIVIDGSKPLMIITGPNAGGKTIVLKTVGLLTLMALTGMPIPASSLSVFPVFSKILADIGDEQSIEDSLSTFAGHISNLSRFISQADSNSMILIDELGTGTDPLEGAALASAILKELRDTGALVLANTHLSEIKGFVQRSEGMINASMEFDPKGFKPLYKLSIGIPGQSYAFETARRYGISERVIDTAKELLGSQKIELDSLLRELQEKVQHYERMNAELQERLIGVQRQRDELKGLMEQVQEQSRAILSKSHRDAEMLIEKTRQELYQLLEEAKTMEKASLKASIKQVSTMAQEMRRSMEALQPTLDNKSPCIGEIKEGDRVYSVVAGGPARIVQINQKQERVKINAQGIEFDVPLKDISLLKEGRQDKGITEIVDSEDPGIVLTEINLIGKRVDEALSEVEPFLNHAFLSGIHEAVIIHGVGSGILKRAIHQHLKGHSLVKGFANASPSEGGAGVTIVKFK